MLSIIYLNQNNNEIPFLSYPNPAEDLFNIEFWEETKNILSVDLYNISGSKEKINDLTIESISEKKLKEVLGHSPLQVLAGAVLGVFIAVLYAHKFGSGYASLSC